MIYTTPWANKRRCWLWHLWTNWQSVSCYTKHETTSKTTYVRVEHYPGVWLLLDWRNCSLCGKVQLKYHGIEVDDVKSN